LDGEDRSERLRSKQGNGATFHSEPVDSIPKKPAVKNFYAVWPRFAAINLWRSSTNWTATMDQSHSAVRITGARRSRVRSHRDQDGRRNRAAIASPGLYARYPQGSSGGLPEISWTVS